MNLNALTIHMMLNLSLGWASDPSIRAALLQAGPLGFGVLAKLEKAHEPLSEVQNNRDSVRVQQRALIDRCIEIDQLHDRKARAVYYGLRALIEAADDAAKAAEYRALLDLLFPIGIGVTRLPYIEEHGAAIALQRKVRPDVRAQLAALMIGSVTLEALFDQWIAAAHELGKTVLRRIELSANSKRDGVGGPALDSKAARSEWIRAVRGLLWCLESEPGLATVRGVVTGALSQAIATAQRRGAGVEDELDGDIDPADDPDAGEIEGELEPELLEPFVNDPIVNVPIVNMPIVNDPNVEDTELGS